MRLENIRCRFDLNKVEQYNQDYYDGKFRGSEATPVNMEIATKIVEFLELGYQWTNETPDGNWERFDVCPGCHTKYGTNYLYVDHKQKLMRTRQTASEFYNH